MVTVGMNYQVREGKNEIFEQVFYKVIDIMKGIDGHVRTDLFTNVRDANSYLIMSEWNDRGAFDGFIASEQFRNVANWGKEEVLAGRPSHNYYGDESKAPAPPAAQASAAPGKCPMGHG
ncbi:MAG: antibiotic biosynthesis monooxygenase [Phycisphaerales bacterium]|nr:antibiotic biosynthesis monooxygenase [Phycisphaerales bacterium]